MSIKLKTVGIILISLLVGAVISFYLTYINVVQSKVDSRINSDLTSLGFTLDALEYFDNNMGNNPELREKLEVNIISNFLVVLKVKPPLTKLQGNPLSNLCRTIVYYKKNGFASTGDKLKKDSPFTKLTVEYLNSIETELKKIADASISIRECKY